MAGNLDCVTCLMSPCDCVLAAAAQEAVGGQDEAKHCPGQGDGVRLLYREIMSGLDQVN